MSEQTLNQIKGAADRTLGKYGPKFKKIASFDTSNTSTVEGAAKIANEALEVLSKFLDESICVVPEAAVRPPLPDSGLVADAAAVTAFTEIVKSNKKFEPRSTAEQNANYLQPIPCAILRYGDKILILKRNKPGHPLHDKYDVWAGGACQRI